MPFAGELRAFLPDLGPIHLSAGEARRNHNLEHLSPIAELPFLASKLVELIGCLGEVTFLDQVLGVLPDEGGRSGLRFRWTFSSSARNQAQCQGRQSDQG